MKVVLRIHTYHKNINHYELTMNITYPMHELRHKKLHLMSMKENQMISLATCYVTLLLMKSISTHLMMYPKVAAYVLTRQLTRFWIRVATEFQDTHYFHCHCTTCCTQAACLTAVLLYAKAEINEVNVK